MAASRHAFEYLAGMQPVDESATGRLMQSMISVQQRRDEKARQDRLDAIAAATAEQNQRLQEENHQIKLLELQAKIAAASDRPKVTTQVPAAPPAGELWEAEPSAAESAAYLQGLPPDQTTEIKTEPAIEHATIGGREFNVPMLSRSDLLERKMEEQGQVRLTPEMIAAMPEEMRPFFQPGQISQAPSMASALAATQRQHAPENPEPVRIDGVNTLATPSEIAAAKAAGKKIEVVPAGNTGVTPNALFEAQQKIGRDFQRYTTDAKTARIQHAIMGAAFDEASKNMQQGLSINASTQALVTAFGRIIDPGSTVRESEYARSPEGIPLLHRIDGFFIRLAKGGAGMTIADLADLKKTADAFMKGYTDSQLNYARFAKRQAEQIQGLSQGTFGALETILPPDALDMLTQSEAMPPAGAMPEPKTVEEINALPPGTKFKWIDGRVGTRR